MKVFNELIRYNCIYELARYRAQAAVLQRCTCHRKLKKDILKRIKGRQKSEQHSHGEFGSRFEEVFNFEKPPSVCLGCILI